VIDFECECNYKNFSSRITQLQKHTTSIISQAMDQLVLDTLQSKQIIENSREFARQNNFDHEEFVGILKSLEFGLEKLIKTSVKSAPTIKLTKEGETIAKNGVTPEVQVFNAVPETGFILKSAMKVCVCVR
jgi:hypothetical protein